jgi:copper chaperone CopZ
MQTDILNVTGMHCGGCTNTVTRALKAVGGVSDVMVSLPNGEATVQYDEGLASPGQLKSADRALISAADQVAGQIARALRGETTVVLLKASSTA